MQVTTDFLIIGTGIAGLSYALKVADHGTVALVTKRDIDISATQLAQGGIATVFSKEDSFTSHAEDTMVAGVYLSNPEIVDLVVQSGPQAIHDLIDWGVKFSRKSNRQYDLTREGGHSHRRILHAKDATGREIERALVEAALDHPNITLYQQHIAVDLITENKVAQTRLKQNRCLGAYVLDKKSKEV
ncbi:MAG: L-aspartate oxidase, partial [Deltaproteobacteria bacterium]